MTNSAKIISFAVLVLLAVFLAVVFSGRLILPQSFSLGPLTVRYYGVFMAAAILAGYALARRIMEIYAVNAALAEDLLFWLIVGGFLGARFYHVLSSIGFYSNDPAEILKFWHGGMSIYGAVFGGLISLLVYRWLRPENFQDLRAAALPVGQSPTPKSGFGQFLRYFPAVLLTVVRLRLIKSSENASNLAERVSPEFVKLKLFKLMDWLAPSLVLGQIIGRFGNFFNYEAFGYPTTLPWKMFVPQIFRPPGLIQANFFHPLFLYEALGNAGILWLLLKVMPKKLGRFKSGALFFSYLLFYNILRAFLELLRTDSTFITPALRLNFLVSLILVIIAASFIYFLQYRPLAE